MTEHNPKEEEEKKVEQEAIAEDKPKVTAPKPPTPRFGPAFPNAHQFRGGHGNNMNNNRQRPGRAANRGR